MTKKDHKKNCAINKTTVGPSYCDCGFMPKKHSKVIETVPRWRQGQTIFTFLEWLTLKGYAPNQSPRMADPFHIPDEELEVLFEEFLAHYDPYKTKKK